MNLIKHCIIDTSTNLVVNIVAYPEIETHPAGFSDSYICIASEDGQIGASYIDGGIVNPPQPEPTLIDFVSY